MTESLKTGKRQFSNYDILALKGSLTKSYRLGLKDGEKGVRGIA